MQGQLRQEYVSVIVHTECAHCSQPMEIEIDSNLNYTAKGKGCDPIVFVPEVDLFKIEEESMINAF